MNRHFWLIDNCIRTGDSTFAPPSSWPFENIANGKYVEVLNSNLFVTLKSLLEGSSFQESLKKQIYDFVNKDETCREDKLLELLCLGIASLQYFVQLNWTGPTNSSETVQDWPSLLSSELVTLDSESLCYPGMQVACCLLLAREILVENREIFASDKDIELIALWWSVRCVLVHQTVLEEKSKQLHAELALLQVRLAECAGWLAAEEPVPEASEEELCPSADSESSQSSAESGQAPPVHSENSSAPAKSAPETAVSRVGNIQQQLRALFWVELAQARLQYSEVHRARQCLQQALQAVGLSVSLIGALGKRTRFQAKDLAQLTLQVESSSESGSELFSYSPLPADQLPRDIKLNDEVRLPQISFTASQEQQALTPVEQALVLAYYGFVLKSQPKDAFAEEELLPYLNCVLSNPQVWPVQLAALLARCKLEAFGRRTVERAMTQTQLLVDCIGAETPGAAQRLSLVYASQMPPRWRVEAELASLLISLGAVNSALDLFLRLNMWEDVVACYYLLELRHKAAEVIRQELERKPSPKLWCLLGDATDDTSCYEKAWDLSGQRSAMAQRHLGFYYFVRTEYEQCVPYLEKSLELNSLQPLVLSRLAYALLQLEDWKRCAGFYRQLCTLDGENFEAWNNLAKAYIKMGEKSRAWKVLQESIKCNFENWKVWDNLMVVSIDCCEYQEALRCYHRLLDLRGAHVDKEVLTVLVRVVVEDLPDNRGLQSRRLLKRTLEFFGRLTSMVTNDARVWQLYAQLASCGSQGEQVQGLEKVVQLLQRAQRCATQAPNWFREVESCKEAAAIVTSLADTSLELSEKCGSAKDGIKFLASPRLGLISMIKKIKEQHTSAVSGEVSLDFVEIVSQLNSKLEQLKEKNSVLLSLSDK